MISLADDNTASARVPVASSTPPAPPYYIHLSERHTRSQDLDQRSSEKQRHQMESQGVPAAAPSSAHAQSCRHMACARVKPKREPAGAPAPPAMLKASQGHQSRTPLPTERPAAGCAGGRGVSDSAPPSSPRATWLGGSNTVLLYSHQKLQ